MANSTLSDAVTQALTLVSQADASLLEIISLSFKVSLSAVIFATIIGIPTALLMAIYRFKGRSFLHILIDTLMALPPVVVGLIVYLLLSNSGPLGIWGLLYTPTAMIIAQTLLITPIVVALALPVFSQHWLNIGEQMHLLGLKRSQCFGVLIKESSNSLITVILAAFGRAIAEIGAVMIVGGNIENHTRVMTTAIAMETRQGNLALALALGLVLIVCALLINASAHFCNYYYGRKIGQQLLLSLPNSYGKNNDQ
jgi:tungstate transport system permease protein